MNVVRYREEEVTEGPPGLGRRSPARSPARSPGRTTGRSFYSLRRQARMETDDNFQAVSDGNTEVKYIKHRLEKNLIGRLKILSEI